MSLFVRVAANACLIAGVLLGVVSLAGLLYFETVLLQAGPPVSAGTAPPEDNLVLGFFHGLGKAVSLLGGVAEGIVKAFVALSAVGVGLGMMLIQTGRGLRGGKRWAKAMAVFLAVALGLVASLVMAQ